MPSYFQTALMLGHAVQHAVDSGEVLKARHYCNRNNMSKLAAMFGWKLLGTGHFSGVYENPHDPNTVFKVNICKKDARHDAWIDYAAFCMTHGAGNPYFLKVYEVALFQDCFVAVMERLERCTPSQAELLPHYRTQYSPQSKCAELDRAIDILSAHRLHDDLHRENVMNRDGQIVIVDPVCARSPVFSADPYIRGNRLERTQVATHCEGLEVRA